MTLMLGVGCTGIKLMWAITSVDADAWCGQGLKLMQKLDLDGCMGCCVELPYKAVSNEIPTNKHAIEAQ